MAQDDLDDVWRALANPLRRRILDVLREGPRTTGELAAHFPDLSRFAVMQHLRVLEGADLVVGRDEGRLHWNAINVVPIRRIYERWIGKYDEPFAAELASLKRRAERPAPRAQDPRRSRRGRTKESSRT
jgi:DNA-binding transcriptional ArsR family regulator